MLSVIQFDLNTPSVNSIHCDTFPFILFERNGVILELDRKDGKHMVACSQKVLINNREEYFSQVTIYDNIVCDAYIFTLVEKSRYESPVFFLGGLNYKRVPSFFFYAPERIYQIFFEIISKTVLQYSEIKQVVIDCRTVGYMESTSIAAMIDLIRLAKEKHCSVLFHAPSQKFESYINLSNTQKLIRRIPEQACVRAFMDSKTKPGKKSPLAFQYCGNQYSILSDRVNYIGRNADLCAIVLETPSVSRVHAIVLVIYNCLYLMDCDSTNGTFINQKKVGPFTWHMLHIKDQLIFGNSPSFTVIYEDMAELFRLI